MEDKRALVLIPARYASSRFPGKPLAQIAGKSMIQRVYENCQQQESVTPDEGSPKMKFDVAVVTDSQEVEDHVKSFGGIVCRVDDPVTTGTARIQLAYERFFQEKSYQLVINVQGDEPLLKFKQIKELSDFHLNSSFDIATLVKPMQSRLDEYLDPNRVKAAFSKENGKCHYFSRAPIPHERDNPKNKEIKWHLHIGVYSFKPKSLNTFCKASESYLEGLEKLEQLRALDLGMSIGGIETNVELMGVDHPSDVEKLEEVLREQED